MIVRNEESSLQTCLDSVKAFADEIIIVDTGSIDKTVDIAKANGAIVGHTKWINDFSYARNFSLRNCHGLWILIIDADEVIDVGNIYHFLRQLHVADEVVGCYFVALDNHNLKQDGTNIIHRGYYPRIFRNYGYPDIKFEGVIHEQILPSILKLGKTYSCINATIRHQKFGGNADILIQKASRNYNIIYNYLLSNPDSSVHWFWLGQTLFQMFLPDPAYLCCEFAMMLQTLPNEVAASNYAMMAQYQGSLNKFGVSLMYCNLSLECVANQFYARFLKACNLLYLGDYGQAKLLFLTLLNWNNSFENPDILTYDIIFPREIIEIYIEQCK